MADPEKLVNVTADGRVYAIPEAEVEEALRQGYELETADAKYSRLTDERIEDEYGGFSGAIAAGGAGLLRGATLGLSDAAFGALGEGEDFGHLRDVNRGVSIAGEVIGGVAAGGAGVGPAGAAARLGSRVGTAAAGAGTAARVGRAALGGAAEGGIVGAGAAVSELALSADEITVERAISSLSSNVLLAGVAGGAIGGVAKGAELGLSRASKALKDRAAKIAATKESPELAEDLAQLDTKGLRKAREAELANIEAARVPQRQAVADDITAMRAEAEKQKLWLATKDSTDRDVRKIGAITLKADKQLDNLLTNPKDLAKRPELALSALRKQEHALEQLVAKSDDLRATFADDATRTRADALDAVPGALERNRALQARIEQLTTQPTSARLVAIDDAKEALGTVGAREKTLPEQMLQGAVFSTVTGAAGALGPLAPLLGAKAAKLVGENVFGQLGKAATKASAETARVVSAFLDVGSKAMATAPAAATRVLAGVAFAPSQERARGKSPKASKSPALADVYKARSEELRSQTMYAPDGTVVMRPEARAELGKRLAPIAAGNPKLADQLETLAARRLEYVASRLPRRPDMGVMQVGPDLYQPSDMEMREFARVVAAVEEPANVERRLLDGSLTPEEAEAYRAVYPERFADLRNQIVEQLGELRETLPYERRLALSIFTGIAVDPAMHPEILAVLQGSFAAEEGSAGGTQAPTSMPQFGSVRAEQPTPAQQREQGETA